MRTFGEEQPDGSALLQRDEVVDLGVMVSGMRHWIEQAITLCGSSE